MRALALFSAGLSESGGGLEASEESETKTEEAEKQLALSAVEKPREEASPEEEPSEEGTPIDSESVGKSPEEE